MKRLMLIAALATTAFPAAAEMETYTIDPNHTFPSFEIGHFGYSFQRGRFNKTSGKIALDTAARTGTVDVTIDAASVDTGHPKLGEHLRSDEFFNAAKFPTLTFKAGTFTFEGDKVKSVSGDLTILGVTRPVILNATYFNCAPHPMNKKKVCGADFLATLKRSDFGMSKFLPNLADDVTLRINVEAIKD